MNTLKFGGFWDWTGSISWNLVVGVSRNYVLAAHVTICFHYNHNQTILILERATNSTNYVNSKQQICSSPTAVEDLGGQGSQHLFQPSWCEVCPPKPAYEKRYWCYLWWSMHDNARVVIRHGICHPWHKWHLCKIFLAGVKFLLKI